MIWKEIKRQESVETGQDSKAYFFFTVPHVEVKKVSPPCHTVRCDGKVVDSAENAIDYYSVPYFYTLPYICGDAGERFYHQLPIGNPS